MHRQQNLFGSLYRWAHRQDENFVTEALVYVVNFLIDQEPVAAGTILDWLLNVPVGPSAATVDTQFVTDEGRPDIKVETSSLLAFVEVKKGSELGEAQLKRYRRVLNRQAKGRNTSLVLLTQYPVTFEEGDEKPDVHRRWHELAHILATVKLASPVSAFVVRQFTNFLEDQVMSVEQVDWQFIAGFRAFRNLLNMLATAIEAAQVPVSSRSAGWEWMGYYLDEGKFWVGIYHVRHNTVRFQLEKGRFDIERLKGLCPMKDRDGKSVVELELDSEATHFFARSKESQLSLLTDFLKNTYQAAKSCVIVETPAAQQ